MPLLLGAQLPYAKDFKVESAVPLETLNWGYNSTIIVKTVKNPIYDHESPISPLTLDLPNVSNKT